MLLKLQCFFTAYMEDGKGECLEIYFLQTQKGAQIKIFDSNKAVKFKLAPNSDFHVHEGSV